MTKTLLVEKLAIWKKKASLVDYVPINW